MAPAAGRCGLSDAMVSDQGRVFDADEQGEIIPVSRQGKRERGIWQRRYWEHQIQDQDDLLRHVEYIHYNPVRHGWVARAADWPHSTLHGYIERGLATPDWGGDGDTIQSPNFGER
jgi:putative transposase